MINNNLEYAGIVTLSQQYGNKKIALSKTHNAGSVALFDFLADCLLGDFNRAVKNRPTKIMPLYIQSSKEGISISKVSNYGFHYLLNIPEKLNSTDKSIIRYSFMIPYDVMTGISGFNAIGLYPASATESDQDISNPAAYSLLNLDDKSISNSAALLVDWDLYIANKETSTTTK